MNPITAETIAGGLDKARRSGDGWMACCPAHDDSDPSLSINDGADGTVLVHCFAGCLQVAVLAELRARGLWPDDAGDELHEYPYRWADGTLHRTKHIYRDRLTGKRNKARMPWWSPKGVKGPHPLYRLPELAESDLGRRVLMVEGEHTCDRARAAWPGEPIVTAGNASDWKAANLSPLAGRTVTICADADTPGRDGARGAAAKLAALGCEVWLVLPEGESGDDLADWLREGRDAARKRLQALKRPYKPHEAPAATGGGLDFMTIAALLDQPEDAQPWLVDGLLPEGGFGVFSGKPKSGKSTAARHLAHCVAAGERWLDRDTATGPVLYLALEEKVSEVRRHFMALGTPRDAPLHIAFHRAPGDAAELLSTAAETMRPRLFVIDTLFRFAPVRDTDAYGAVLDTLAPLQDIARASGAHVLAVHHDRKAEAEGGDRVLGSTAIFGTIDVLLSIERRYGDNVRVLSSIGRYGKDLPETVVELRPDGGVRLAGAVDDIQERRARERILEFVTDNPGATRDEIREAGLGQARGIQTAITGLYRDGKLARTGTGRKGDAHRYSVPYSGSRPDPGSDAHFPVPLLNTGEPEKKPVPEPERNRGTGNVVALPTQVGGGRLGDAYRRTKDGD